MDATVGHGYHRPVASPAINRVFHPIDLAFPDEVALAHAVRIALSSKAELTLFHAAVGTPEGDELRSFPSVRTLLERWGLLQAGSKPADVLELGLRPKKVTGKGPNLVRAVHHYLQRKPTDLVVLGTAARQGLARLLESSVAEPIARDAGCMTLFLPDGSRGLVDPDTGVTRLDSVLIPVDEEPDPFSAVECAESLGRTLTEHPVKVDALHVGDNLRVAEQVHSAVPAGCAFTATTRPGPVVDAILARADEVNADLIAMATYGREGFADALRGSITEQVLRSAGRPLLAIPLDRS